MSCSPFGRSMCGNLSPPGNKSMLTMTGNAVPCGRSGDGVVLCSGGEDGPCGCAVSRFELGDGELLTIGGGLMARLRCDSFKTSHAAATNTANAAAPKASRQAR